MYFYAIDHLPLADAVVLNQLNPFFVILLAALFLGEKIKKLQIPAIVSALMGVLFIAQPQFDYAFLPAALGIASSIFAASAYTMIRHLRLTDTPNLIVFYFTGISTIITIPFITVGDFPLLTFCGHLFNGGTVPNDHRLSVCGSWRFVHLFLWQHCIFHIDWYFTLG